MLIDLSLHISECTIKNKCIINCVYSSWDKLSVFKLFVFFKHCIWFLPEWLCGKVSCAALFSMRR
jgi:hypothetical protein